MQEQELRERLDTVDVPPVRLTVDGLIGAGRRRVRRRRALRAAGAAALVTGVLLAMPSILVGRNGGEVSQVAPKASGCPVRVLPVPAGVGPVRADAVDPSGRYILGNGGSTPAGPGNGPEGAAPVLWTDGHPQVLPLITTSARGTAVNASGVVAALAVVGGSQEANAVVRYIDARPVRLTPPPGRWILIGDARINSVGDIVVSAAPRAHPERPGAVFLWPAGSTTGVKLPLPSGVLVSGLTDDGDIVGNRASDEQKLTSYVWDRRGNGRRLTVPAGQQSQVLAARGEWAVGAVEPSGTAARWNLRTGALSVLDAREGATGVNDSGWVVTAGGVHRDDVVMRLAPVGNVAGYPVAIADDGTVVGSLYAGTLVKDALAWSCR
jgi:hypothetical protein